MTTVLAILIPVYGVAAYVVGYIQGARRAERLIDGSEVQFDPEGLEKL